MAVNDEPPDPVTELDAIRWLEDPMHGPSRPRSWHVSPYYAWPA